jgi:glycosyltransferase involved in cell wall biosynthesis
VLFNPVDLSRFSPASEPPSSDCWQLLAAGTHYQPARVIDPLKTLKLLLDGGQRARLTIAGDLRWRGAQQEVERMISQLGVRQAVTLKPQFTSAQAVDLYREAHLLLHLKYHDPCPTVVIEALACGVPVIGSRSGGMPELVGDDGGELLDVPLSWEQVSPVDPAKIADSVKRVMRDHSTRSATARARAVRLFDAQRWVAEHARLFERLVAAPQ